MALFSVIAPILKWLCFSLSFTYCKNGVRVKVLTLDLARLEADVVALGSYNYGLDIFCFTHGRCLNWVSEQTWFSNE